MNCKVKQCRYYNTHVTKGHQCGICHEYGHGEIECYNIVARKKLFIYYDHQLEFEDRCKFGGCINRLYHKTISHNCIYCYKIGHSPNTCELLLDLVEIDCPICKQKNHLSLKNNKIYALDDKCKICMDNTIEILLPTCKHACLCLKCSKYLNKKKSESSFQLLNIDDFKEKIILTCCQARNLDDLIIKIKNNVNPCYIEIKIDSDIIIYIRRLNNNSEIEVISFPFHIIDMFDEFINGYEEINLRIH